MTVRSGTDPLPAHSYWTRFISTAGPEVQARYVHNFELFLIAVDQEVKDRISGEIPSLADYVQRRRHTSACKPSFDLIEYCCDMELPDYVIENPSLESMKDCVNDLVSWSNVSFYSNFQDLTKLCFRTYVRTMSNSLVV
jgi:alpha-muurolene/germacrene-A/gamma-muurolene/(+)-delta-cadinol synthase